MLDETTSPGAYLRSCRIAAGKSLTDVAEDLATEPRLAEHARAEWIERIEDGAPAAFNTIVALMASYPINLETLGHLAALDMNHNDRPPLADVASMVDAMHGDARGAAA